MFPIWGGSHNGLDHRYHHPHIVASPHPHGLHGNNHHPGNNLGLTEIHTTKDKFVALLDIRNFEFSPEEITVKTDDDFLVVECEQLEKVGGCESTVSFKRRILLPVNCLVDDLYCAIGTDGILRVTIPRSSPEENVKVHQVVYPTLGAGYFGPPPRKEEHVRKQGTDCSVTKKHLMVKLELPHFSPDEITVKSLDDFLIIEGDHKEKDDGHGFITRKIKRRYRLPVNADMDQVLCEISTEGVLKVTVPRVNKEGGADEKIHPLTRTDKLH